jgi:hypothetical protein
MLPFKALPYGYAPGWCFPVIELSLYVFWMWCALDARRKGRAAMAYLLGGTAFGVLLETFEVMTGSYTYGRFQVMLWHAPMQVPLWVGCGWGVIMYTARLFSDAARLPLVAAKALDTLLALNIDLGIDAVAYRMHMWHWDWTWSTLDPLKAQWFGIPYGNFVGWITVVFCFSVFSRMFERWLAGRAKAAWRNAFATVLAIACSLGVLMGTEMALFPVMNRLGVTSGWRLVLLSAVLIALAAMGWRKRAAARVVVEPLAQLLPLWFHGYFFVCLFALGFWRENAWLTAVTFANLLVGVAVHVYPHWSAGRVGSAEAVGAGERAMPRYGNALRGLAD